MTNDHAAARAEFMAAGENEEIVAKIGVDEYLPPGFVRMKPRAAGAARAGGAARQGGYAPVAPVDRVLEIGCSYGEATAILAAACPTVLGVDHSRTVLKTAAREAGESLDEDDEERA